MVVAAWSVSASRVLIVDDGRMARESLAVDLAPHYSDIRCAWDTPSLLSELADGTPDLILLNNVTLDSAGVLQVAADLAPSPKVIVFGLSQQQASEVISCAEAGAAGLHLRSQSFEQLLALIRDVDAGHANFSPQVSEILIGRIRADAVKRADPRRGSLTQRESEILTLMRDGLTNKQIATQLYISVYTVKNHVRNLLAKLGATSRVEIRTRAYAQ